MSVQHVTIDDCGVGALATHDHPCSIYSDNEELKSQFVPYLQAGLALGERCFYFIDENTRDFVINSMQANSFDLQPYLASGAFVVESTANAHLSQGHFAEEKMMKYWQDALRDAQRDGFPAMRAAVEMTWALSGMPGCDVLAPYEARLNRFTDSNKVSVICQYSRKKFSASKLKDVIHAHPLLVTRDAVMRNPSVIHPDKFEEGSHELDLQHMVDNMHLISQLQKAHEALESAFEDLYDLSHSVSHELQEPIATIRSYQKLLSVRYHGRLGRDADDFINQCNEATAIVERMIDDLWHYARINKPGSHFTQVDSNRALGLAMKDDKIESMIASSGASINYAALPKVFANESQLIDMFRRLVDNAIRHCDVKAPEIYIGAKRKNDDWEFVIQDNGPGIDRMSTRDVFKLFNRLDKRPGPDGSGMGLPICKKIINHHECKISMDSDEGKGTKVFFSLPAVGSNKQAILEQRCDELAGRRRRRSVK